MKPATLIATICDRRSRDRGGRTATPATLLLVASVLASGGSVLADPAQPTARPIEFNRDIRPILSENCYYCHGPDPGHRKGKVRLDEREAAIEKKAIVPGKPDESSLIARIFTTDEDDIMPPPDTHKILKPAQKELLKRWIAAGAEYQSHWAYAQVKRPPIPALKAALPTVHPIDAFIQSGLEARAIQPSPPADRRRLLRRLTLDLTGLPPTRGETAAFLEDSRPGAYEREVNRLLRSPRYGERMAVGWLDTVRFSDTVGYHGDQTQNIFPYRDYVIAAFNRNKPFNDFTIEQIAGDLLHDVSVEQWVATGFNRLNMVTREGGAQPGEYLAKYASDRVRTIAITWLGSTMGCAECHDHKFDPFTMRDFYSLGAFFNDVKQWGVYSDYKYTPNPDLKDWSNDHPFPPQLEVDSDYLLQRKRRLEGDIQTLSRKLVQSMPRKKVLRQQFESWRESGLAFIREHPNGWAVPSVEVTFPAETNKTAKADGKDVKKEKKTAPPTAEVLADGSIRFGGDASDNASVRLQPAPGWVAAVKFELIPDPESDNRLFRGGDRSPTLQLSARRMPAKDPKETKVNFLHADADRKEPRFADGAELIGVKTGWKTSSRHASAPQTSVWILDPPIRITAGDSLELTLKRSLLTRARFSVTPFAARDPLGSGDPERFGAMVDRHRKATPAAEREQRISDSSADNPIAIEEAFLVGTAADPAAYAEYKRLYQGILECRGGRSPTLITVSWEPATTRVLPRGNWQDQSGAVVEPATPVFLSTSGKAEADKKRLTRLDLARWLVARDNPLTARVFMNRLWKQFFGIGLSAAVDDLGAQGEPPVHPALLDWLAAEFMDSGWDIQHMVRLIVNSTTYQQESRARPELVEMDPNNRLLAFHTPRRLEAEFVRDNALFAAGLLNLDLGGPSARPYQPGGYYANLQFPDRDYVAHPDDRQYRRGLYTHWQRTFLHPMLANFDAPSREECTATRNVSNTPQQALTLLNDPTFVEAARVLAASLLTERGTDARRIRTLYERVLGRPPEPRETESLARLLASQRAHFKASQQDAAKLLAVGLAPQPANANKPDLAAWTSVCRVVLNLHESITRY